MKREPTKPIVVALCMLVLAACSAEDKGSSQNALTGGKGGSDYVPPRAGSSAGSGGGGSGGSAGAAKAGRGAMTPVGDFAKAVATLAPIAPPGAAVAGAGGAAGASAGAGGMTAGAGGMTAGAGGAMMAGAGGMTAGAGGRSGAGGSGGRGGAGASGRGGSSGRGGTSGRGGSGGAGGMSATSGAGGAGGAGAAGTGVAGAGGAGAGGAGAGGAGSASSAPLTGPQGSVTFTNLGASVEVSIAITQCQSGKSYPIHIHSGMSCADEMSQGGHWDPPRGEGIPDVPCTNAIGMVLTQRDASDDKPWTVGGSEATNVIGHVVVLHDPEMPMKRIACGEIKAAK